MKRGTVVWVNLDDAHPPQFGKTRPAIVISNTEQNAELGSVVVVPLSSRSPAIWPLRLLIPPVGKLTLSFAVTPGIRQVAKRRLLRTEGIVLDATMGELAEAVLIYLGE